MKKNNVKKIAALIMMCVMLCGMSTVAYAAVQNEHVCAFSFSHEGYSVTHITYHTYIDRNTGEEEICDVTLVSYYDVYTCGCGAVEHRNIKNNVRHSGYCGE